MSANQQGSRLFYNTAATAWTNLAAGAAPTGWTQVTNVVDLDPNPHQPEEYDDSSLEDTAPVPACNLKPGSITFSKKKNAASHTLRALCDAGTKKTWAVVYLDGTAEVGDGRLICTSAGKASSGDFKAKVQESFKVICDAPLTNYPVAA